MNPRFAYMVFRYMDRNLTGVLSQALFTFDDAQPKDLCQQMLVGLSYLPHSASHGLEERPPQAQSIKLLDANPLIPTTLHPIHTLHVLYSQ